MTPSAIVPVENLIFEPYASILCYPHADPPEVESRIMELTTLGVNALEFTGDSLGKKVAMPAVPVLGKGYSGIVVLAYVGPLRLALKIRKLNSCRDDFYHEAEMLQKANGLGVGPEFVAGSKNFLLSQHIGGGLLTNWLLIHKEKTICRRVVMDILEQCRRLDEAGLNHGELSTASGHLLMDTMDNPFIIDFETASIHRTATNVTAVSQYLFIGNNVIHSLIQEIMGDMDKGRIIKALQNYKRERTRSSFNALLQLL